MMTLLKVAHPVLLEKRRRDWVQVSLYPIFKHIMPARFMRMHYAFELIKGKYIRTVPPRQSESNYPATVKNEPYLITHLKSVVSSWLSSEKGFTRTRAQHSLLRKGENDDGRRTIPTTIINCIRDNSHENGEQLWGTESKRDVKAPLTWIVCYLNNILPDTTLQDWEAYDCSHRCITSECTDAACLCWESKAINQSHGNLFCCKQCVHENCGKTICSCQSLHYPHCL